MPPARVYLQARMIAGSNVLSAPAGSFVSTDAGKYMVVWGSTARPFASTPSVARITAVTDSTTVTLSQPAANTFTGFINYGSDNVPSINKCIAAQASSGGQCFFPAGGFLLATAPYYVLTGAYDDGSYGTPAGGSGAVIVPTLSGGTSGSVTGWTVQNGGHLYTPNSTLQVSISGGCPLGYDMGPCGWAWALAFTNGLGEVASVSDIFGGYGFNSVPTGKVIPLGGDGAAASSTPTGSTMNLPTMSAFGAGYAGNSALAWWAVQGNSGCQGWQNWGGTIIVGGGSVATDANGKASGTVTMNHTPTGCVSAPQIVFGPAACNSGTATNPAWGQCFNLPPINPIAMPVQIMLTPGVSLEGFNTGLTSVWDGNSVDNNEPAIFGGTIQSEHIGGFNLNGFMGILGTNNVNYSKIHDMGFNTGFGMWTTATDVNFRAEDLSFSGYVSWVNGGSWCQRLDFPSECGGFFDANSVNNITVRVTAYGGPRSMSQKFDDWFAQWWHPEFSGASADFWETSKSPQALKQRQTSHVFGDAHQANSITYRGVSSTGWVVVSRTGRPTGAAIVNNLVVKQASRYLFWGDLGAMTITNIGGEAMSPITGPDDPYRLARMQEGALVFTGGNSSAGATQATLNGIYWTSASSNINRCLWSLNNGGEAAGTPVNTLYTNNVCSNVKNGQFSQNTSKAITLPTSCSGLQSGVVYNKAGTPAICP
jgi:hypothetical protein